MKIPRFKTNTVRHHAIPTGDEEDEQDAMDADNAIALSSSERHTVSMNRMGGAEGEDGMRVKGVLKWARKGFDGRPLPKHKVIEWLHKLKEAGNQSTDRKRIIDLAIQEVEEE